MKMNCAFAIFERPLKQISLDLQI